MEPLLQYVYLVMPPFCWISWRTTKAIMNSSLFKNILYFFLFDAVTKCLIHPIEDHADGTPMGLTCSYSAWIWTSKHYLIDWIVFIIFLMLSACLYQCPTPYFIISDVDFPDEIFLNANFFFYFHCLFRLLTLQSQHNWIYQIFWRRRI